jgi:ATP-dependent Lhr-like helicase
LLQSIACWLLYKEGFIEPPQKNEKPYDILVHQALSITKGRSGIILTELVKQLKENFAFNQVETSEIEQIIKHLIEIDFLEKLQHEVIIGVEGEKIVNSRDFYSVFKTEENFKVINAGNTVGEIPFSPQIIENENILLSARIWKIKFVDHKAKKIEVTPTKDGKKPMFFGGGVPIHQKIREKILEILYSDLEYDFLDQPSCDEIETFRKDFSIFNLQMLETERPLLKTEKHLQLFTFSGTRINRTIQLLLNIAGIRNILEDSSSSFDILVEKQELISKWDSLIHPLADIDPHIANLLHTTPTLLDFSKWGQFLPESYQVKLVKDKYFNIEETGQLLATMTLIENNN